MSESESVEFSFLRSGMVLHASCSDEDYGTIMAVNPAIGNQTVDSVTLLINDPDDLVSHTDVCSDDPRMWVSMPESPYMDSGKWLFVWPPGTKVLVRGVPVVRVTKRDVSKYERELGISPYNIELDTPGNGCYRCTKYFSIHNYAT